jgi:hypothetical protein
VHQAVVYSFIEAGDGGELAVKAYFFHGDSSVFLEVSPSNERIKGRYKLGLK